MNQGPALKSFQDFKKDITKEINAIKKNKELRKFASKFNAKKKSLETKVKKAVQAEIKQANKFLDERKKELTDFQKKIKTTIKRKMKTNKKKNGG